MDFQKISQSILQWFQVNWIELLKYLIFLILGFFVSAKIAGFVAAIMRKKDIDKAVISLIRKLIFYSLVIVIIFSVLTGLGFNVASLVTIIGAAGLAIGFALKDSLSHFAAGVLLVIFRPFTIGDYVNIGGDEGIVEEIGLFHTILKTLDNRVIFIPNSSITNNSIFNFTREDKRRVDIVFGIGYEDDLKKAKELILKIAKDNEKVLKEPEPQVVVFELGDNSVNLQARAWAKSSDYWDVYFNLIENVKLEFDKNGISIPYPQLDVHVNKE